MYISLFFFGGLLISLLEGLPMLTCLFEAASAVGTVGLTLGVTPSLGLTSRGILIALMFLGRVGGLTLIFAALSEVQKNLSTVGLTLGVTPSLGLTSRGILIALMFLGRVGGLTLIFAALSEVQKNLSKLPREKITVG